MEMRINNEIDAADFIDQKNKLNAEIAEIESQFNAHQQSNAEWKDVLDYGKSYITDIRDRCESLKDVEKKVAYIGSIFPRGLVYDGTFLSNQQTLEIISSCNAPKRANVTPWRIELQFPG